MGVEIVRFADDITLEVYGETIEEVKLTTDHSIKVVEAWMRSRKLELAHHKAEVAVVNNRKLEQQTEISVGEYTILSKRSVKHLGVMIRRSLHSVATSIMPVKETPQLLRHCSTSSSLWLYVPTGT